MHTSRHTSKNSSFSTQDEHLMLLGLEALTDAPNLRYATRSIYKWIHRFVQEGVEGLTTRSGGRPQSEPRLPERQAQDDIDMVF